MPDVTIRYWAAAKDAAGLAEESVSARTLSEALDAARGRRGGDSRFTAIIARSSFIVDEIPVGKREATTVVLSDGAVIEVLPAFAGG